MNRQQLEHIIRAAATIANQRRIAVVGSQAILAARSELPEIMLRSQEADVYPLDDPAMADVIEGAIGAGSIFEDTFGYYADGVGPDTAKLPAGWLDRALKIPTGGSGDPVGYCPEPNDLAVSKLVSGRDKDREWLAAGLQAGVFDGEVIAARLDEVSNVAPEAVDLARQRLRALCSRLGKDGRAK